MWLDDFRASNHKNPMWLRNFFVITCFFQVIKKIFLNHMGFLWLETLNSSNHIDFFLITSVKKFAKVFERRKMCFGRKNLSVRPRNSKKILKKIEKFFEHKNVRPRNSKKFLNLFWKIPQLFLGGIFGMMWLKKINDVIS